MSSPIPLYHQVGALLRQRIAEGVYPVDTRLPAENDLAEELGVSRATLRQAMAELVRVHLVRREQGRGTFVLEAAEPPGGQRFVGSLGRLLAETERAGVASVELQRSVPLPADVRRRLELDDPPGVVVRRVRTLDGLPFAYTINYLPPELGELVDESALHGQGLMQVLQARGVVIHSATQAISAERADVRVSQGLDLDLDAPVLAVERLVTGPNRPIQLVRSWYRTDRYVYSVRFHRDDGAALEDRFA